VKLSYALRGIQQLAFDSVTLIYFVERASGYVDLVRSVMRSIDSASIVGVASILVLAEVLVIPIKSNDSVLIARYETVLSKSRQFKLKVVNARIAHRAAVLHAQYGLKTPDALHLATAIETGCDAFLTNDLALKRITEIRVLVLDELELDLP
jgi:predicted nucleic acid-binding protein